MITRLTRKPVSGNKSISVKMRRADSDIARLAGGLLPHGGLRLARQVGICTVVTQYEIARGTKNYKIKRSSPLS